VKDWGFQAAQARGCRQVYDVVAQLLKLLDAATPTPKKADPLVMSETVSYP
jgi:hypothetical protein